jgi:hypothetical protein
MIGVAAQLSNCKPLRGTISYLVSDSGRSDMKTLVTSAGESIPALFVRAQRESAKHDLVFVTK